MNKDLSKNLSKLIKKQEEAKTKQGTGMEKLLKKKAALFKIPQIDDIIEGKVISVSKNEIEVDIAGIGVGVIRGPELYEDPEKKTKLGDKMTATVLEIENEAGKMELSSKKAHREAAWREINEIISKEETIEIKVSQANKGGLTTQIKGIPAFLPVSQLHHKHYPRVEGADKNKILAKLNNLINEALKVKIIDSNQEEDRLIISEKQASAEKQKKIIEKLKVGDIVSGEITGVVDFGAFIRFDGLEGLIHISELAWKRIENPGDVIKMGDKVKAKIISIDSSRISLSLKALKKDPWEKKTRKYKIGEIVEGEITKLSPFGAFVQLDRDIHGLAHISEITSGDKKKLEDLLNVGQKRKFKILSIEPEEHRLGLSIKALEEEKAKPKPKPKAKAKPGSKAKPKAKPQAKAKAKPGSKAKPKAKPKKPTKKS